jgi:hypothetical protein
MAQVAVEKADVEQNMAPLIPALQEPFNQIPTPTSTETLTPEQIEEYFKIFSPDFQVNSTLPTTPEQPAAETNGSNKRKREMTPERLAQLAKARDVKRQKAVEAAAKKAELAEIEKQKKLNPSTVPVNLDNNLEAIASEVTRTQYGGLLMNPDFLKILKLGVIGGALAISSLLTPKLMEAQRVAEKNQENTDSTNALLQFLRGNL